MTNDDTMTVEQALSRLEEISGLLQKGEISLNESVQLFEEATGLYQFCKKELAALDERVKLLSKTADGELAEIPFTYNSEE